MLLPAATDLSKAVVILRRPDARLRPTFLVELAQHQSIVRNGNIVPLPPKVEWAHHPRICFWEERGAERVVTWLYQSGQIHPQEPLYIESLLRHFDAAPTESMSMTEAAMVMGIDPTTPPMPEGPREPQTVEEAQRMLENDPNTPKLPEEFRHDRP